MFTFLHECPDVESNDLFNDQCLSLLLKFSFWLGVVVVVASL